MKKLFILLILFSFASCVSAQVEQVPIKKSIAKVSDIHEDWAILDSGGKTNYRVPAGDLVLGKEYVFWLEITDCGTCPTAKAIIVEYALTSWQAQEDQEEAAKRLSNRRIIK